MKLKFVAMSNFLSYADQALNLDSMAGVIFLVGRIGDDSSKSNGSGKSAVFDAISWCLYGKSRTSSDDELIRIGEKEMSVHLDFEIDGKCYEIVRSKKYGRSQSLAFTCITDNIKLTGNAVKETQANIIGVLGMDDELYENTVFARQGRIDEFPRQNPSKRKEMLQDILKINQYETWENQAKELCKSYGTQYETLKATIETLQAGVGALVVTESDISLKETVVAQVHAKVAQVESDIAEKQKEYAQVKTNMQMLDKEYDNNSRCNDDLQRIERQLKYVDSAVETQVAQILKDKETDEALIKNEERVKGVLDEINKKMSADESSRAQYESMMSQDARLNEEIRRLTGMIGEYNEELDTLRAKLERAQELGNKCPVCLSAIGAEQKKKIEEEIIAEGKGKKAQVTKLTEELESAKATQKKLKDQLKATEISAGKSREYERDKAKFEKELLDIGIAKNRVEYTNTKVEETKQVAMKQKLELSFELRRRKEDLSKSDKMIEAYKAQVTGAEKMEAEITGMTDIRATYVSEEKKATEELHRMKYELESKKKKEQELITSNIKIEKVKIDFFVYSELEKAFGKNGIPLLVIENALAELQVEVTNQLNTLTGGAISVEFRTQKELKSGKQADTMDILVSDKTGVRDFNMYSGGEKMRVALAIRLGLSRLLSRRAGKQFSLLIIDEISDLDAHGMDKFVELIGKVAQDYKQIFVVSHINELKDRFGQVLQVVKDKDGSKIYA